jgi:AAA15 family ATPase/GTPase
MLIEFSVENYRSFRDRTCFSMEATADRSHPDNVIGSEFAEHGVLKTAAMFGANASGKTKLIEAVMLCRRLAIGSHTGIANENLNHQPFAFDGECANRPTRFEIEFATGGVRYRYSFSYDSERIVSEKLQHWPNGRAATVFSRNGQDFKFNTDKAAQEANSKRVRESALYLSVAAQFNYKIARDAADWFLNGLRVFPGGAHHVGETIESIKSDEKLKAKTIEALRMADFGITDIKHREAEPKGASGVFFSHRVRDGGGGTKTFDLPMDLESSGASRFAALASAAAWALSRPGSTLIVDDMGANLHSDLCRWIASRFHDPGDNAGGSQLIFNTHNLDLLDQQGLFRRDQIWFVEKDAETGASSIKSLSDFRERSDRNVKAGYLAGRYGGRPLISGERLSR